jgi:ketosteroid isomerase-like protein
MGEFDPIALAIDWLDAYRAQSIDRLLSFYDDQATQACGCRGQQLVAGKEALRAFWLHRFGTHPAYGLEDIRPDGDAVVVSYITNCCIVQASLIFNEKGKIAHALCGPLIPDIRRIPESA